MKAYSITLQRTVFEQIEVEVYAPTKDAAMDMAVDEAITTDLWSHVSTEDFGIVDIEEVEEDPEEEDDWLDDPNNPASRHHY